MRCLTGEVDPHQPRSTGGAVARYTASGHNARFLQGADTVLKPEDEVVVFIHRSWAEVPFM